MPGTGLVFDILAKDHASEVFRKVGESADRAGRDIHKMSQQSAANFGHIARVGAAAFGGIAVAAAGGAVVALKAAASYQESLTALVTGAGESEKNINAVGQGMLDLAGKVGISADDLSKGMYLIESSGQHGAAGLLVLKAAAEGAKVGAADMATVADGLTTALNDYRLPASQAALVTSKLVATVAAGKTHMGDLAGALATVLPAASTAKIGLDQILGAMATMTALGTPAADAATYLKQTISNLSNPTAKAAHEMKGLGLSSIDISSNLGKRGLTGTLEILTDAIQRKMGPAGTVLIESLKKSAGSTTAFQKILANLPPTQQTFIGALATMVGGTKSMQAALELTGANAKTFNDNVAAISKTTVEAGGNVQGFALTQKDFNSKLDDAKQAFHSIVIELGDKLLPVATTVIDKFSAMLQPGSKFRDVLKDLSGAARGFGDAAMPIFRFIGDHPKLFTDLLVGGGALAAAFKVKGALTGGTSAVASLIPGVSGNVQKVFVVNPGFGGKVPTTKIATKVAEKVGTPLAAAAAALARRLLPTVLRTALPKVAGAATGIGGILALAQAVDALDTHPNKGYIPTPAEAAVSRQARHVYDLTAAPLSQRALGGDQGAADQLGALNAQYRGITQDHRLVVGNATAFLQRFDPDVKQSTKLIQNLQTQVAAIPQVTIAASDKVAQVTARNAAAFNRQLQDQMAKVQSLPYLVAASNDKAQQITAAGLKVFDEELQRQAFIVTHTLDAATLALLQLQAAGEAAQQLTAGNLGAFDAQLKNQLALARAAAGVVPHSHPVVLDGKKVGAAVAPAVTRQQATVTRNGGSLGTTTRAV